MKCLDCGKKLKYDGLVVADAFSRYLIIEGKTAKLEGYVCMKCCIRKNKKHG